MILSVPDPRRPRALRHFADQCRSSALADQAARIRDAMTLTRPHVAPAFIEVMIAAGAFESAALALIGKDTGWMLSRSCNGRCLASIIAPGMSGEVTAEGASPALALLAAWASAALPVKDRPENDYSSRPEDSTLH